MADLSKRTTPFAEDELLVELAKRDELAAIDGSDSNADSPSTLQELKAELDTLASQIREPAPVVPFEDESDCRRVTELVEALGVDVSRLSKHQPGIESADDKPLGQLSQYQLLAKLGQGGMGTVYKALHTRLDKVVALKVLPEQKTSDDHAVARFEREMRAVGKLEHENIVRAMDANEHEGQHYLVMEYVDGVDLSQLVHRLGPLPVADACELVRQAAIGLQHAYEHQLVHRDIKPSNLMLTGLGQVKLLDLGLARLHNGHHGELTSTGQMMGTIDYMAPEQTGDSHDVDIRADIYGLGATLFKLLTGRAPYSDERLDTVIKKLQALATQPVPSVQDDCQDVSPELSAIISKMLSKEAANRYSTPQEVAEALMPYCAASELPALMTRYEKQQADAATSASRSIANTDEYLTNSMTETTSSRDDDDPKVQASTITVDYSPAADASESSVAIVECEDSQTGVTAQRSAEVSTARTQPATGRRWSKIATTLVGLAALFAALTVITIQTNKGTVKVASYDPSIEVTIKRNGKVVDGFEVQQRDGATSYFSGEYEIELKGGKPDGVAIKNDKFTLTRGRDVLVEITRETQAATTALPQVERASSTLTWQSGPSEDVLPGLVPRPAKLPGIKRWQIETQQTHTEYTCVDVSPNGDLAAVGDKSGAIRLYNTKTLELVRVLLGHRAGILAVAWSPDGTQLASGGWDQDIHIWGVDGKRLFTLDDPGQFTSKGTPAQVTYTIAWHPDGKRLAAGYDYRGVLEWDVDRQLAVRQFSTNHIRGVAWDRKGSRLAATTHDGILSVWNADGTSVFEKQVGADTGVAWSPDGTSLMANGPDRIPSVFSSDGELIRALPLQPNTYANKFEWTQDGTHFITCHYGPLRVWTAAGELVSEVAVQRHGGLAAWLPDGNQLIGASNVGPTVYLADKDGEIQSKKLVSRTSVRSHAWAPDGSQLVLGDYHWHRWQFEFPSGQLRFGYKPDSSGRVNSLSWSPDGKQVAAATDSGVWLRDAAEMEERRLGPSTSRASIVQWSPDGKHFTSVPEVNESLTIWNADGSEATTMDLKAKSIAWAPDSQQLAVSTGSHIEIRDLRGTTIRELPHPVESYSIVPVSWHPRHDIIATADSNGMIRLYSSSGEMHNEWKGDVECISLAWSPDGTMLASTGWDFQQNRYNGKARIWDDKGKLLNTLDLPHKVLTDNSNRVSWSPDSRHVFTAEGELRIVWDVKTGEPIWTPLLFSASQAVVFNGAGQIISGDRFLVEDKLVVIVENEDGSLDLLKPSEFEERIGQSLTVEPYNTPAQHRELAEWILEHGGTVAIRLGGGEELIIKSGSRLPSDEFTVFTVGAFTPDHGVTADDHRVFSTVSGLRKLYANFLPLGDALIQSLRRSVTSLTQLHLMHSRITDDGLKQLGPFQQIDYLNVGGTSISDEGLRSLANLKRLQLVRLLETSVTEAGVTELSKALPNCRIEWDGGVIEPMTDLDLQIAQWAIRKGGGAGIRRTDGSYIVTDTIEELPSEPFHLEGVYFDKKQIDDEELRIFAQFPSRDRGFDVQFSSCTIAGPELKHLKGLQLNWLKLNATQVTDHTLADVLPDLQFNSLILQNTAIGDTTLERLKGREFLHHLDLTGTQISDEGLGHLNGIKIPYLFLSNSRITGIGLFACPELHGVEHLSLKETQFSDEAIPVLKRFKQLSDINLSNTPITDTGLKELVALNSLRQLNVAGTKVTEAGITTLSKALPDCRIEWDGGVIEPTKSADQRVAEWLKEIGARGIHVTNRQGKPISFVTDLPDEEFLIIAIDLHENKQVTDDDLTRLKELTELAGLTLSHTGVTDKGLAHLRDLPNLSALLLHGSQISDDGMRSVAEIAGLRVLYLTSRITDKGLEQLAHIRTLRELNMHSCPITDEGLIHFSDMIELTHLNLGNTSITDVGLSELEPLRNLIYLNLVGAKVTEASVTALSKALPNCRIEWDGGVIEPSPDQNRRVAAWVQSHKGSVGTSVGTIGSNDDLPDGKFDVITVNLSYADEAVTDAELDILTGLDSLTGIYLTANAQISDASVAKLTQLTNLTIVSLGSTQLTDAGLRELAALKNLQELDLHATAITDAGISAISELKELRKLELYDTEIGNAATATLAELPLLESLFLHGTNVSDQGVARLTDLPLKSISLNNTNTGDESVVAMSQVTTLESIDLGTAGLTDAGLAPLKSLPKLTGLNLKARATQLTDAAFEHLAACESLRNLQIGSPLTAAGLKTISTMSQLQRLDLQRRDVTDEWLDALHDMKNLQELWLVECPDVTVEGLSDLMLALPDCSIQSYDAAVQKKITAAAE